MPFYEYQCKNCGHDLEAMQKISEPPLKKCPHCGKPQLQRLMSAPVFRLKGAGWYETDFKGDKDNQRNLADRPEADLPAEVAKDLAKDTAKEGTADAKAGANGKDVKDAKEAKAEKGADKPVEKAAKEPANKPQARRSKTRAKKPLRKPAPPARRRG
ncbi:MAG TPA: FmdB family zinc ribbon protein [Steroidobacteraceae bacterium]|jgi:putative FmdB family regulatory protein